MEQKYSDEIEIDLREIFAVLMGWLWLILLVGIIAGASAFAFSKFAITPTYESTTRIVILNKETNNNTLTYSDLQMGTQLTQDYAELIQSRYVLETVINNFGLNMTYGQLLQKIDVATPSNTRIIDITLTDTDPAMAKQLVDEIRNVAAVRIEEVMDIEAVNVVDEGNIATTPANPNIPKWVAIGFLLGAFAAAAVVVIRFLLDDTIKSSEDIERYLGLSTLALIPIISTDEDDNSKNKGKSKNKKKSSGSSSGSGSDLKITDLSDNS